MSGGDGGVGTDWMIAGAEKQWTLISSSNSRSMVVSKLKTDMSRQPDWSKETDSFQVICRC
jgi:hypothetical protein